MGAAKWVLTREEQVRYMDALAQELAPLRAKAGISQVELCNLLGISRQTYSAVEGRKRSMTWQTYLSLIFFFDSNLQTREMLRALPAYPREILKRLNDGREPMGKETGELYSLLEELDEQALHAIRTVMLMEYARCKKIPGDMVIKAFDGITMARKSPDISIEQAILNIRNKSHADQAD